MCSLQESLPPPSSGTVTIAERNGDLIHKPEDELATQIALNLQGIRLPKVEASVETLASLAVHESAQSAFLPNKGDISLWKQVWYSYKENGVNGMLQEMTEDSTDVPWLLSGLAYSCLAAVKAVSQLQGSIYPHMTIWCYGSSQDSVISRNIGNKYFDVGAATMQNVVELINKFPQTGLVLGADWTSHTLSREELISEFSRVRDWEESEIRASAWHPHTNKTAVAWKDDSVKIYTVGSDVIPTLKHRHQKGVSCLAWKPFAAGILAVGCQSCVLIWHLDPSSLSTRPSASSAQQISHQTSSPITTLAWDPRGQLLITASPWDTTMRVWNVPMGASYPVGRGGGGGVSLLQWSPDKSRVLAATPSAVFRVWETHTWTCEKWTQLSGRLQAACWSPDSRTLLFCSAYEPAIYSLIFNDPKDGPITAGTGGALTATQLADLTEVTFEVDFEEIKIGGLIQDMVWDPTGERLAVLFQKTDDENHNDNVIALFNTRLQPVLELIPCGFIQSEPDEEPALISFQPNFDKGALLTICYKSGNVKFIPFLFIPSRSLLDNRRPPFQALNGCSLHGRNIELFSLND